MDIEFDPAKDEANIAKHGVSLARAADFDFDVALLDRRFVEETRYRAFGQLDGRLHCLAFTMRGSTVRAISLRRARTKELRRHTAPAR